MNCMRQQYSVVLGWRWACARPFAPFGRVAPLEEAMLREPLLLSPFASDVPEPPTLTIARGEARYSKGSNPSSTDSRRSTPGIPLETR